VRVVVAPDSFKGSLGAAEAAEAIAAGVRQARPDADIVVLPMADGGEGTLDVLVAAHRGLRRIVQATGPLGDPVRAAVGLVHQASTAVVELAGVAGYTLIPPHARNPLKTTTFGVGEVLRSVIDAGIEEIILTIGGSATVDGGAGMMQALGMALFDRAGRRMPPRAAGGDLERIGRFDWPDPPQDIENVQFTIAVDVLNPACGPNGAAAVFGPQKGADADAVQILDRGLAHWADLLEGTCGRSIRNEPGTGAAGGVALPLLALTSATIVPGIDLVCEAYDLASVISGADLVVAGEGRLDAQSMMGKVVGSLGRLARDADVPCAAIVGSAGPGFEACRDVLDCIETLDAPLDEAAVRLTQAAARLADRLL